MEKIILKRLLNEIDNKNILCNKKFGFKRGRRTKLNLDENLFVGSKFPLD